MLTADECRKLLERDELQYENFFILDCNMNTLEIIANGLTIELNESQKRLLVCLIEKVHCKRKIINIVWYENHQRICDNNYHQLTFQLRALFQRHHLPAKLVVTVPYYGLKLNDNLWHSLADASASRPSNISSAALPVNEHQQVALHNPVEIKRRCNLLLASLTFCSLFII